MPASQSADAGAPVAVDVGSDTDAAPVDDSSPVQPLDRDCDNVADAVDTCPATLSGDAVDGNGCSLADLVPCHPPDGPWPSKDAYVAARQQVTQRFFAAGFISLVERDVLLAEATTNGCGE